MGHDIDIGIDIEDVDDEDDEKFKSKFNYVYDENNGLVIETNHRLSERIRIVTELVEIQFARPFGDGSNDVSTLKIKINFTTMKREN